MIKEILKRMQRREITPLESIKEIDTEIGGITGVIYRNGFTIQNHNKRVSIQNSGLDKKQAQRLQDLAVLAYWQAQQNGSRMPGEVHLGKGLSTKHYAEDFRKHVQNILIKYSTRGGTYAS